MGDHIHNHLQNVTIGGGYVGGHQIHRESDASFHSAPPENRTGQPTIFLSYCHQDEKEADRLELELTSLGMLVKRDIRDIGPWRSIRKFMDTIREQDIAVLLVSGPYLKSRNCMYEVLEIMKETAYRHRIFPAVLEPDIYHPEGRAAYIAYWEEEYQKLDQAIQSLQNKENASELFQDLRHIKKIQLSIGEFLTAIADMNNPGIGETGRRIAAFLKAKKDCGIPESEEGGMTMEKKPLQNTLDGVQIGGDYTGGNRITNVLINPDHPRDFIITHQASIRPVSYFTGREQELEILRRRIQEGRKSVLVSGMGGIGKTHICRKLCEEYIARHAADEAVPFQYIGYVEYNGDMGSSLVTCLKFKKPGNPADNQEAAWLELEHVASHGKLLLFVDNVNRTVKEDPGLKRLGSLPGTIILTSRRASFMQSVFERISIGVLPLENCRHIYRSITNENSLENDPDLDYILRQLAANHTLTVELLARTADSHGWSPRQLRQELENRQFRLTFEDDGETVIIQEAYEKLFSLAEMSEGEINILEAFSLFPYMPLPDHICEAWLLRDAGETIPSNPFFKLYEKGWLQRVKGWQPHEEQYCYQMHPVLCQFIRGARKPELEQHMGLLKGCQENVNIPNHGSSIECQQYLPFAESIANRICVNDTLPEIVFLKGIAYLLKYIGSYSKAEILYKRILNIEINRHGENHINTAASYNNLAELYRCQGLYDKALPLYQQALHILQKTLGEEHPTTQAVLCNTLFCLYKISNSNLDFSDWLQQEFNGTPS